MKALLSFLLLCSFVAAYSQKAEQLIIITTDGFRWQEVFMGMDSAIANNSKFNQGDSLEIFAKYWATDPSERRKKLLPFLWNRLEKNGQIFGNRNLNNKVDNSNPYWFSYPGYNEIFTGYPDTAINSNKFPANPHTNILEFLNKQPAYKNKVAAFGAWIAFDRILNEQRSGIPVFSAFDRISGKNLSPSEKLMNSMQQDSYKPFGEQECLDVFTHYKAFNYLVTKKPKVLYISYGETDEWAHEGHYKDYLDAAHQVDQWIKDIWEFTQKDPRYKNKTAIFISTDHGRGDENKEEWTSHNNKIKDAHQIWFAVIGPGIQNKGEIKEPLQLWQNQFAQTMAWILGMSFKAQHPIGGKIELNK